MIATHTSARKILATLGMRAACGYLKRRGVPVEVALYWLAGSTRGAQ